MDINKRLQYIHLQTNIQAAQVEFNKIKKEFTDYIKRARPSCRVQEAYLNSDGSNTTPHMDIVCKFDRAPIPEDELIEHIIQEGIWTEVAHDEKDTPLYRRVVEVKWPEDAG